jgi:hypothetical protein
MARQALVLTAVLGLAGCGGALTDRELDADSRQIAAYRAEAELLGQLQGRDPPPFFEAHRLMLADKVDELRTQLEKPVPPALEARRAQAHRQARELEQALSR